MIAKGLPFTEAACSVQTGGYFEVLFNMCAEDASAMCKVWMLERKSNAGRSDLCRISHTLNARKNFAPQFATLAVTTGASNEWVRKRIRRVVDQR